MKPADHPEFFVRPPPPGRSRESSIRLDRLGRFWHDGSLVEHRGMARSFAAWIDRHPLDGRFILNNGYDWSYFEVEGAPCHVLTVYPPTEDGGPLQLELADGTRHPLDPATLWIGGDDGLYCLVRDGRFAARFSPSAQLALEPYLVESKEGRPALRLQGRDYPVSSSPGGLGR